jgi:hypothetical protein
MSSSLVNFYNNSAAATWALFALTQNVEVQKRLRDELLTVSTDKPTMDELNGLPFLDCVVRETLRLYAPVRVIGSQYLYNSSDVVDSPPRPNRCARRRDPTQHTVHRCQRPSA